MKDCLSAKIEEPKKADNLNPARVFALTESEAGASPSVVTCQLSSAGTSYIVLIDSGTTYSFLSRRGIYRLCRSCDYYTAGFGTLLPTGELVAPRRWIRSFLVLDFMPL